MMVKGKYSARKRLRNERNKVCIKNWIIIIIIIMLVIVGNIITQNNTNKTVETISEELDVFRNEISNKNVRQEDAQNHIGKIKTLGTKGQKL